VTFSARNLARIGRLGFSACHHVFAAHRLPPLFADLPLLSAMSFDATTLHRIASLARLDVPADQLASLGAEMSAILVLVDQLQGVDTKGVAPLAHPLSAVSEMALRLRPDAACTEINREANMQNAPMTENGLFLVPKVLD